MCESRGHYFDCSWPRGNCDCLYETNADIPLSKKPDDPQCSKCAELLATDHEPTKVKGCVRCTALEKALRHHIRIYRCHDELEEDEQQVQEDRIYNRIMKEVERCFRN